VQISRSTLLWYVVPILLFFLLSLAFFLRPIDLSKTTLEHDSDPLTPNVQLQLSAGEVYAYESNLSGSLSNTIYSVAGLAGGCMAVRAEVSNQEIRASSDFCIDVRTGEIRNSDVPPDFFQPWMLSLDEGFSWTSRTRIVYPPPIELEDVTNLSISVEGLGLFRGRPSFKVRALTLRTIDGKQAAKLEHVLWIDSEKRVLLGSSSSLLEVRLVSAPFDLE